MKKKIALFIMVILVAGSTVNAGTRISWIGSNPYFSWIGYPQDILQWQGNIISYYSKYEQTPWWGDIDEPMNKPNQTTYTTTGIEEINGDATFEHSGRIHFVDNQIRYVRWFRENLLASFDLNYDVTSMQNEATGNMTDDVNNGYIPFDYSLHHNLNDIYLRGILGFTVRDNPAGLKLRFAYNNTLTLNQEFIYTKAGITRSTGRALWGWSTSGCNHIFGPRSTEGDAWLQNEYSIGPLYRLDLQGGITLPLVKLGVYSRYKFGHQDQYRWNADTVNSTGDATLDNSFQGEYTKSPWTKTTREGLIRLYGNVNWRKGERYALNTFISLDYVGRTFGAALSENLEIENDSKEKARNVSVEFNPNVHILLGDFFHYIDAALLLEYGYTRLNNTYEYYIGGGTQETYWNTSVVNGDEVFWERFSFANEHYFDVGTDISAMLPLINNPTGFLGFGFMLLFDTRCTFQTKYYGQNSDNGTEVTFTVNNRRENFTREIWFNTALLLQMMKGPFHVRFEVNEPFLYSLLPRTRITDKNDKQVLYEHEKQPLWLSQKGFGAGLFVAYELARPF